jgi:hypothetical protein
MTTMEAPDHAPAWDCPCDSCRDAEDRRRETVMDKLAILGRVDTAKLARQLTDDPEYLERP